MVSAPEIRLVTKYHSSQSHVSSTISISSDPESFALPEKKQDKQLTQKFQNSKTQKSTSAIF